MISAGTSRRFVAISKRPLLGGPLVLPLRPPRFSCGVADTAHIAALRLHDIVEQGELSIITVHDVAVIWLEPPTKHGLFIGIAAAFWRGRFHGYGRLAVYREMSMQPPVMTLAVVFAPHPRRLDQPRQRLDEGAIDDRQQRPHIFETRVSRDRLQLAAQLGNDR